jgi:CubicO group peptidase (beta-lactamase class C family)
MSRVGLSVLASWAFAAILAAQIVTGQAPVSSPTPSDSEIRKILADRVDTYRQSVGIVVGVIEPQGRRIIVYGKLDQGDAGPLNGDTVFEIGSITKVFTSLLLSDMVQRGEVALTDPVSKYLPAGVKAPQRNGKQITLLDLATHTSGLPRMPTNFNPDKPYADYTVAQLYEFLSSYQLPRDIGAQYEYSNAGVGLLGNVLALRAGMDYDALVRSRIIGPLGMRDTGIALSPELKARLAMGHDDKLKPTPSWNFPTLAGAGAIRSTANDMLAFLAANLGYTQTPLAPAMTAMLAVRRPTDTSGLDVALGWHVFTKDTPTALAVDPMVWHNGGTDGYRSFVGFYSKSRIGVVVLSNAQTTAGVDDIGKHLLNARAPLLPQSAFQPSN